VTGAEIVTLVINWWLFGAAVGLGVGLAMVLPRRGGDRR
jgi:hypothetical protein